MQKRGLGTPIVGILTAIRKSIYSKYRLTTAINENYDKTQADELNSLNEALRKLLTR